MLIKYLMGFYGYDFSKVKQPKLTRLSGTSSKIHYTTVQILHNVPSSIILLVSIRRVGLLHTPAPW